MIIKTDGTVELIKDTDLNENGTIKDGVIKKALDNAWLSLHSTTLPNIGMYVDDEGLFKKLPINYAATMIYGTGQPVMGTAVLTKVKGEDDYPLTEDQIMKIKTLIEITG